MKLNIVTIILCAGLIIAVDLSIHNVRAQQEPVKQESNPEVVTTQEIRIVDKHGHLRAVLNGAGIALKDDSGNDRIQIGLQKETLNDDPTISLLDKKGNSLVSMQVLLGAPEVNLSDESGNPLASLSILAGQSGLDLYTPKSNYAPNGSGDLRLSALASGPYITFYDSKAHEVMDFSASPDDIPRIQAYNRKHKLIWQKP